MIQFFIHPILDDDDNIVTNDIVLWLSNKLVCHAQVYTAQPNYIPVRQAPEWRNTEAMLLFRELGRDDIRRSVMITLHTDATLRATPISPNDFHTSEQQSRVVLRGVHSIADTQMHTDDLYHVIVLTCDGKVWVRGSSTDFSVMGLGPDVTRVDEFTCIEGLPPIIDVQV